MTDNPWPLEVRLLKGGAGLHVSFDNGREFELDAELLRVESPSAEVRGHSRDERQIIGGKRHVRIIRLEPTGNYALRLIFDDLHDSGIYSWRYLYRLGDEKEDIRAAYLAALTEKGLSRDR